MKKKEKAMMRQRKARASKNDGLTRRTEGRDAAESFDEYAALTARHASTCFQILGKHNGLRC